jgi:hypothetical protein
MWQPSSRQERRGEGSGDPEMEESSRTKTSSNSWLRACKDWAENRSKGDMIEERNRKETDERNGTGGKHPS